MLSLLIALILIPNLQTPVINTDINTDINTVSEFEKKEKCQSYDILEYAKEIHWFTWSNRYVPADYWVFYSDDLDSCIWYTNWRWLDNVFIIRDFLWWKNIYYEITPRLLIEKDKENFNKYSNEYREILNWFE